MDPINPVGKDLDISHVSGNASDGIKRIIAYPTISMFPIDGQPENFTVYSYFVSKRMVVTEFSVDSHPEEPSKKIGRVVCELEVDEGASGNLALYEDEGLNSWLQI